ncbi:hypothetical protein FisN_2Hu402 [Fistulifera solaris]|uniref:Uncharacterized protein n=1 Tax=Fistulifera solaris TaxID=1519565 RepID=A0A1Z5KKV1_FISSO|nr:hypothetical protein FisN_2Hu402 [Fistulifera solaris]|eukprot:GAX26661.1 hypothetical protein FisN_2Hu402 [Fistulifera solaris]
MYFVFACSTSTKTSFTSSEDRAPHERKSAFGFGSVAVSSTKFTTEDAIVVDGDDCGGEDCAPASKFVSRHADWSLISAELAFHERSNACCRDAGVSVSNDSGADDTGEDSEDADSEDSTAT